MKYTVLLFQGGGGWITATVPALEGCVSQGRSRDEALLNVRQAIEAWMSSWLARRKSPPPKETLRVLLGAIKEALEIQRELREEDGEDVETSLELTTVQVRSQAAA